MEGRSHSAKPYGIVAKNRKPPDYGRVVSGLTDAELRDDLAAGRGDEGYRAAAAAELARRRERLR